MWEACCILKKNAFEIGKTISEGRKYRLVDQIVRASRSATANLAEGYGRFHYREFVQFCRQSRGSLYEIADHLITAYNEGFIKEEELKNLRSDIEHCVRILNGFIKLPSKG